MGAEGITTAAGATLVGGVRAITGRVCALLEQGGLQCWGWNENGELGYGTTENVGDDELPTDVGLVQVGAPVTQVSVGAADIGYVSIGGAAIDVATGKAHTCVLLEGGVVRCWGDNSRGQLGLASIERIGDDEHPSDVPAVRLSRPAVDIAAGSEHNCALLDDGSLQCWGFNQFGQLEQHRHR